MADMCMLCDLRLEVIMDVWNSLPLNIHLSWSLSAFKAQVKTHLFHAAFPQYLAVCLSAFEES